jgi:hypothetical protein
MKNALTVALLLSIFGCVAPGAVAGIMISEDMRRRNEADRARQEQEQRERNRKTFSEQADNNENTYRSLRSRIELMEADWQGFVTSSSAKQKASGEFKATAKARDEAVAEVAKIDAEHGQLLGWVDQLKASPNGVAGEDVHAVGNKYGALNQRVGLVTVRYGDIKGQQYSIAQRYK